ncbi:MAG: serine/threonine-protein kinase [Pirellulales bacterium]
MKIEATPCDRLPLERLLAEDAGPAERELTSHVEQCPTCQSRLESLAAEESWWNDARESLASGDEFNWKPDETWSSPEAMASAGRGPQLPTFQHLLAPASHPELLGRLGRYDIERVIGAGGMGIVLKAHDSELNRPIAVKMLASHLSHVGAARERFAREGRAAAAVVHEHVVAIYNVETSGEVPFLVMQYVPGRSLQARVDAEGPLAVEEILRIGMQAASGLTAAHAQGLVHRDVKPSNILLEESVERAVLTDFGLARTIDDASLTHTGLLAGTPHYMSPEQASGAAIDHRSDLFGLGAVLYFMATGHPPFRADGALAVLHRICREPHRPVWQTNKDIPDELSKLIDRLLEKKAGRRPATAAAVSAELAAMLSRYQQYGPSRRRLARRHWRPRRMAIAGACAAALLAATAWGLQQYFTTATASSEPTVAEPAENEFADAFEREFESAAQFDHELEQTKDDVQLSERASVFVSPTDDPWSREVTAIQQDLTTLESREGSSP